MKYARLASRPLQNGRNDFVLRLLAIRRRCRAPILVFQVTFRRRDVAPSLPRRLLTISVALSDWRLPPRKVMSNVLFPLRDCVYCHYWSLLMALTEYGVGDLPNLVSGST